MSRQMMIQERRVLTKRRFRGGLVAPSLLALLLGGCAGGKPDIGVATTRHDFGRVKQGDVVSTEIAVRNSGKRELRIESVATSCGCTSARVEPKIIPSGSEGKLFIRYDSGSHPDKGPIERHVYIASNDPEKQELELIITANVVMPMK